MSWLLSVDNYTGWKTYAFVPRITEVVTRIVRPAGRNLVFLLKKKRYCQWPKKGIITEARDLNFYL